MRVLREARQAEVRKHLHNSIVLDIGAGSFPISPQAITLDRNPEKHPQILANACEHIPFPSESVDFITALEIVEHFHPPEREIFLGEIRRILKPHGKVIFTLPNYSPAMKVPQILTWWIREHTTQREYLRNEFSHTHIGIVSPFELAKILQSHSFEILEERRLFLYDYLIEARKL